MSEKSKRGGPRPNAGRKSKAQKAAEAEAAAQAKAAEPPPKLGRPTDFTPELAEAICEAIANTPRGLDFICETTKGFPSARTVHRWLAADDAFRQNYALARDRQADLLFDECLEIADDRSGDTKIVGRDGEEREVMDAEFAQRSRIRIDTRKWMAGKLAPKKYGERASVEVSGKDGKPIEITDPTPLSDRELAQRVAHILQLGLSAKSAA